MGDCVMGSSAQQWTFNTDGTIQSVGNPSYCWDENSLGSIIYIWTCDGSSDQYFTIIGGQPPATPPPSPMPTPTPPPATSVTIVADRYGYCVDVPNDDAS